MSINDLKEEYGVIEFNREDYVLITEAWWECPAGEDQCCAHYESRAIRADAQPDDTGYVDTYTVIWNILPEAWEAWENGSEDEDIACDWENPDDVYEDTSGYFGYALDEDYFC